MNTDFAAASAPHDHRINTSTELSMQRRMTMSRMVFDIITSAGGVAVVVALVVAGGLLTWGHSFVNSNVRTQLGAAADLLPAQGCI
jgi:hypothetical protein